MRSIRTVVVNADDFGFAPGVNRGILEAHRAGTLSSASMMVNTPAFGDAAAIAREQAPRLGVGLHFNILTGQPLSAAPTLTDPRTGAFYSLATLARRAFTGGVDPADVRRECDSQLVALEKAGIAPTHVDSHRHTHALPGILRPVLASALAARVRIVRRPLDQPLLADPVASVKMLVLYASWRQAVRSLGADERALITKSPAFRGITLQGAPAVREQLLAVVDQLGDGVTEIMLHPGYDDAVLAAQDPYRTERERELRALTSPEVIARFTRGDVRLARFGE